MLFPTLNLLFIYISTFQHMCAMSSMAIFCSFLIIFLSPETEKSISIHVFYCCHRLWCPVYCWGWFCWFALFGSIIWLPYLLEMIFLIWHAHTSILCLILRLFPYIYQSIVGHNANIGHADVMWSVVLTNCWHSLHLLFFPVCNISKPRICNICIPFAEWYTTCYIMCRSCILWMIIAIVHK